MHRSSVELTPGLRLILTDTITKLRPEDAGAIVVSGSHGGLTAAEFALIVPLYAVFFNDAGVGKDRAGIAGLDLLERGGRAAGTVAHESARIGDSRDMWENGVVSHLNAPARAFGLETGEPLRVALTRLVGVTTRPSRAR
jgi:hypothetical protein